MDYSFDEILQIIDGKLLSKGEDQSIQNIIYDTRKASFPESSMFIAFKGTINDGHDYIQEAYDKGVRSFIISKKIRTELFDNANIILVNSSLHALQKLAKYHREQFEIPVLAITGSNGKTIVKEWLGKCMSKKIKLVKSPKSYNSQIGVALSLLQISEGDELAIIEAGISQKHEMRFLERMIKPLYGIFTNIGDAHGAGFDSLQDKLEEKLLLFKDSETIIYNSDQPKLQEAMETQYSNKTFSWARNNPAKIQLKELVEKDNKTHLIISYRNEEMQFITPFRSPEFLENLMHVISCLILFNYKQPEIQSLIEELDQLQNRLELYDGINNNLLINDSYSLDMASLQLAFEFQDLHSKGLEKYLIISDFDHQINKQDLYRELNGLINEKNIKEIFAIGIDTQYHDLFSGLPIHFFNSVEDFFRFSHYYKISESCILIKGARRFKLENIFQKLSKKIHQTILETNFSALDHNINYYSSKLKENTKLMAVIKAEAYGSGSEQIAHYLSQKNIDYLAVAILDEAINIRQADCVLPIMVFNVQEDNVEALWDYELEPEVYSLSLLDKLISHSTQVKKRLNIHLKLDTGMKRLGFSEGEIESLIERIINQEYLKVKSVFSHLAASEASEHDTFSKSQIVIFNKLASYLEDALNYSFMRHILNTGGIVRFPEYQMDMVRIGLGLYGIDQTSMISDQLNKVHSLKARVLQIKELKAGQSTGYSRSGMVEKDTKIAIISIGYADGLLRAAGNGNYSMKLGEHLCPTIGNICMDVSMLDVSKLENIKVGDIVVVFDESHSIENLAKSCNTISYEIISRIAPRVKRIYTYH